MPMRTSCLGGLRSPRPTAWGPTLPSLATCALALITLTGCNSLTAPSELEIAKEPAAKKTDAAKPNGPGGAVNNATPPESPKTPTAPEAKPIKLQPPPAPAPQPAQPPGGSCGG